MCGWENLNVHFVINIMKEDNALLGKDKVVWNVVEGTGVEHVIQGPRSFVPKIGVIFKCSENLPKET